MAPLELKYGQTVSYRGRTVIITSVNDLSEVEVMDPDTGESFTIPVAEIESASRRQTKPYHPLDPASPESEYWEIAKKRFEIIKPLLNPGRTKKQVEERAREFNLNMVTLYRWIKRYEESGGQISALIPDCFRRGGKGKKRISPELEKLMEDVIETVYLNPTKRVSVKRTYQVLVLRCREAGIKPPHINTLRNRIKELSPFIVTKKREGITVAQGRYGASAESFEAEYPLEVIQTDHTQLDIIVVDEQNREPIGRPYLTLAMDVYSRMVYGYYLSLEAPGYFSVAQALLMGILPKDSILRELGIEGRWEIWGIPDRIHVDNAKEFRSSHLENFCQEYGIALDYRPRKTPHYGGHIERLIRTINQEIHNLPGTTFSNTVQKKEYKPEKYAAFTLPELERWLVQYIVNYYHKRIHTELGMTPEEKYRIGIFGDGRIKGRGLPRLITGEEAKKLWLSLLPSFRRTIQKDGVHFEGLRYFDSVFKPFIRSVRKGERPGTYTFKYDPRNIKFIYFRHPETGEYYRIPCRDRRLPEISLWEFRNLKKKLNLRKKYNEMQLVEDIRRLIEMEGEVEKKSKKVKRRKSTCSSHSFRRKVEDRTIGNPESERKKSPDESFRIPEFEDVDNIEPFEIR